MSKIGTFHVISGFYRDFPNCIFWPILIFQKCFRVIFLRSLRKNRPKNMYRSSKSHFLPCFTWWPEMTLTCIMVTKHKKWYLQMSVTLSMPIYWLCLRLTSKFCSPISPSPRSRTFWLWPDLWRHWWPRGHWKLFAWNSFSMAFEWRLNF